MLDFYIQACAIEVDTTIAARIAASLANGGVSAMERTKVLSAETVKNTLSLMFSCGMYDYSGRPNNAAAFM